MLHNFKIAGWQKVSLIDYPCKVCSVLFLAGCNMNCHYCHNSHILNAKENKLSFNLVLKELRKRRSWIDAVVVSGGEPTTFPNLLELLYMLKSLKLQVKLDTNGTKPSVIQKVVELGLVDYVALDVKATAQKYQLITKMPIDSVLKTADYLRKQKRVPYMFRTTISPLLNQDDLVEIAKTLVKNAPVWQIQQCRCVGAYSYVDVLKMVEKLKTYVLHIVVKNI